MLAPQTALQPEYNGQSLQQDHLYKSEHPNILTWIKWEGRGMVVEKGVEKGWKRLEIFFSSIILIFGANTFYFNGRLI